ncbi:MAG: BatA and WFA domain-containing protein [Clostridia bacterium]|nr:BatA and WFA domain-containing protein [Clostridia bacterium]
MTFLYPLGLLGLIGVPILILVYILKNKFTEQVIPSTYLWTLSEKFLNRRNPLSRLSGIISLILQLLLVVAISLSIAHPVIILSGQAQDYCFILDSSGSMSISGEEGSRFEEGKDRIAELITDSTDGSSFTLITAADTAEVIYEGLTDKEQAILLLERLTPLHAQADITEAIGIAQGYFNGNSAMVTYLVSDSAYASGKNISIINLASGESNLAIDGAEYTVGAGAVTVNADLVCYGSSRETTVSLIIYPTEQAAIAGEEEPIDSITVTPAATAPTPISLRADVTEFYCLELRIEGEDSLMEDNRVMLYNIDSENSYHALLVSDHPYYIKTAITAVSSHVFVDTVATKDYESKGGYDLYIFDSFTPDAMPESGAVWFFNPTDSLQGSGFSVQDVYAPEDAMELSLSTSSATTVKALIENMNGNGIYVTEFMKCSLYDSFYTLLEHKGNPVIFTGTNDFGNREVVFAFDLQKSNFAMLFDFIALTSNLIDFSFPTVLEQTNYLCGEDLTVNVISGCESIVITGPSGSSTFLDTSDATAVHTLNEAGVHKITVTTAGSERDYYIFSEFPVAERAPLTEGGEIGLAGSSAESERDGFLDNLAILFIALALLFSADWMVYCYEKYQLR